VQITINEAMVQLKIAKERLSDLKSLRDECASETTSTYGFGENQRVNEKKPKFDVVEVDKKVSLLEIFIYKVDALIKTSNALTKIDVSIGVEELLTPISQPTQAS